MNPAEEWSHMSSSERYRERATRKHKRRQKRKQNSANSSSSNAADRMEEPETAQSVLDDEQLFHQAVLDHAITLGMDPEVDEEFLWIAEKALTAELPPDWELGMYLSC